MAATRTELDCIYAACGRTGYGSVELAEHLCQAHRFSASDAFAATVRALMGLPIVVQVDLDGEPHYCDRESRILEKLA